MKKLIIAAIAVASLFVGLVPAGAHVGSANRLRFFHGDTGSAHWQHGSDSPLDVDAGRLKLNVPEQTGDDYSGAYANGTGINGRRVGAVRNLSFDFRNTSYVGAGSPRISVEVDTNDDGTTDIYAYLSAIYCNDVLGDSDWSRADFTGRKDVGCSFYDSTGALYSSTGDEDAWTEFANAHTGAHVLDAYLVQDEVGTAFVDRLAFQNHMFVRAGTGAGAIKHCANEGAC